MTSSLSHIIDGLTEAQKRSGPWLCFHCEETFTDPSEARLHFGHDEDSVPACKIKAGAEGSILRALREAEQQAADAWRLLHNECSDVAKAFYTMRSRHSQTLIAAEELGYERGLSDAALQASSKASDGEGGE